MAVTHDGGLSKGGNFATLDRAVELQLSFFAQNGDNV
jgi:hypothetical protein